MTEITADSSKNRSRSRSWPRATGRFHRDFNQQTGLAHGRADHPDHRRSGLTSRSIASRISTARGVTQIKGRVIGCGIGEDNISWRTRRGADTTLKTRRFPASSASSSAIIMSSPTAPATRSAPVQDGSTDSLRETARLRAQRSAPRPASQRLWSGSETGLRENSSMSPLYRYGRSVGPSPTTRLTIGLSNNRGVEIGPCRAFVNFADRGIGRTIAATGSFSYYWRSPAPTGDQLARLMPTMEARQGAL